MFKPWYEEFVSFITLGHFEKVSRETLIYGENDGV